MSILTIGLYRIPLGIRPSFANMAGRGFSPLSVGYSSNSPCPATEAESEWTAQVNDCQPALKREEIESNHALGYQQGPYTFNGLSNQDASRGETYPQYMAYGQQQQTASDNMLGYSFVQTEMSELQMPRPTPATYGAYGFA